MELTIEQALQQGIAAHKEGKLEEAERLYRAILQSRPSHPDANHNLGVLAVSVNKIGEALPFFKTALEANPQVEQFWLSYADALMKEQQYEAAKQVIADGQKQGFTGENLNALGTQLAQAADGKVPPQGQLDSLLEHYQAGRYGDAEKLAISITQKYAEHQFGWKVLGAILQQTGRKSEAVNANQRAVDLSPQDAEAHNNLGATFKELARLKEAETCLRQAIALKPDYPEACNNLGLTLVELGKYEEAKQNYVRAIALKPDFTNVHLHLGIILQKQGKLEEAATSLRQAIALKSDFAEAHSNLGNTLQELGRLEDAEESYKKAIALKPDYAEAHNNLGVALKELGKMDEAEISYKQAIALNSDFDEAHNNLGILLMKIGKYREGLKESTAGSGVISFDLKNGLFIK